jgi:hypothetical protein
VSGSPSSFFYLIERLCSAADHGQARRGSGVTEQSHRRDGDIVYRPSPGPLRGDGEVDFVARVAAG